MRKTYIIANWKMNPQTIEEARALARAVERGVQNKRPDAVEVVLCPPFPFLQEVKSQLSGVRLGAQDCFWENAGSFTGEISPLMLRNTGCEYVIIGHSERRIYQMETDEMVAKKVKAAMEANLNVVLCIGENATQRNAGQTREVIVSQLEQALRQMSDGNGQMVLVAYEPIWAISGFGGKAARGQDTEEALGWIRHWLAGRFGSEAERVPVLYGGSVNSNNVKEHVCGAGADGALVGSASLNAQEFIEIVRRSQCKEEEEHDDENS